MKKNNNLLLFDFFVIILIIGTFTFIKNQKDFSETEKRYLEKIPKLNLSNYYKGNYQEKLEKALADQILYSNEIKNNYNKLFNVSSTLKNNLCVEEYINIGNGRYLYGCNDYIVFGPTNQSALSFEDYNSFFEEYSKLNKTSDVYYYIIDTSIIYNFKEKDYSYNMSQDFKSNLKGKYKLSNFNFKNFYEYSKYFYKTDHHWNYKGSYKGYKEIMKLLGEENIIKPNGKYEFKNIEYYGSHSQQTRYFDIYDIFKMYKFNIPNHDTYIDGMSGVYGKLDLDIQEEVSKKTKNTNMYAEYYGIDYGEVVFDFNNPEKENILIISNSFDNAIDELIATHFNKTYILDYRYYKDKDNLKIKDYLKEHNINKVLVIADYFFLNDNLKIRLE